MITNQEKIEAFDASIASGFYRRARAAGATHENVIDAKAAMPMKDYVAMLEAGASHAEAMNVADLGLAPMRERRDVIVSEGVQIYISNRQIWGDHYDATNEAMAIFWTDHPF